MRIILFIFLIIFLSCGKNKQQIRPCTDLASIFATEEFAQYYRLCRHSNDTIVIYSKNTLPCQTFTLACGKTITLKKAYFPVKVNEGPANPPDAIAVSYTKGSYTFINVRSNMFYSANVDDGIVTVTETGSL